MANRSTLHKSKIEDFKRWLDKQKIRHRPGKDVYQILQVYIGGRDGWQVVYDRNDAREHYTVPIPLEGTVRRFICDQDKPKPALLIRR